MLKLCLDENINPMLIGALKPVFRRLSFTSVSKEGLRGFEDEALFEELASRQINGLITLDQKQLVLPSEREKLRATNLHWIGLPMPDAKGYRQQVLIASAIIHGLRAIIDQDFEETPHMYLLPASNAPEPGLVAVEKL